MKNSLCLFALALELAGCGTAPLKPGRAVTVLPGASQTIVQPENPGTPSSQVMETTLEKSYTVPAQSVMTTTESSGEVTNVTKVTTSAPMPVVSHETHKATAVVGAAQKDTARELSSRFAAVRPVQYVGVLLIVAACALAYFGWWTKAAIVGGVGIGMIVVAAVIPGHEMQILAIGGAVAVIGALLVLYTYHKGTLDSLLATGEADAKKVIAAVEPAKAPATAPVKTVATPAAISPL